MADEKSQAERFKEAACQFETYDYDHRFEEKLKKMVKQAPPASRADESEDRWTIITLL